MTEQKGALIVGAGAGLSAELARGLSSAGYNIALAARNTDKLKNLADEVGATCFSIDASNPVQMASVFSDLTSDWPTLDVAIYNPSARVGGPTAELDPEAVRHALMITAYGGFLMGKHAAQRMEKQQHGNILFTGATASVKGFPEWASFAMGKFALRGLAQSMARELGPKNIHVAHFVIDGGICPPGQDNAEDTMLDAKSIAQTYLDTINQHKSAWVHEVDLRPWSERF